MFIKALEYETVNPEQDASGNEGMVFDPNTGAEKRIDTETARPGPSSGLNASRNGQMSAASAGVDDVPTSAGSDQRTLVRPSRAAGPDLEAGSPYPAP